MVIRGIFNLIISVWIGYMIIKAVIYRFKYPEKTETQLFIDLIGGKPFKNV